MSLIVAFFRRQLFNEPPIPVTSFEGRTVIVTGSNTGLGLEAARSIVSLGASRLIIACRNVEKGKAAAKDIQQSTSCAPSVLDVWQIDMSSYASVVAFSDRVKTELPRLDALIGNAGIYMSKFARTEGNEQTITTNVVSLALLGFLLHPKLRETATKFNIKTHFTVTGSELYEVATFKERKAAPGQLLATLNDEDKANMGDRYQVSKLLVLYVIKKMAALSPSSESGVIINCIAPGFCKSNLGTTGYEGLLMRATVRVFQKMFARDTAVGARTLVGGASAGPETHGEYCPDCKITPTLGYTKGKQGADLQESFWSELKAKLEAVRPGVTNLS